MEGLKRPDIAGVLVSELSRLYRPDGSAEFGILEHFERNKKRIYLPDIVIEPWTPQGKLLTRINGVLSGHELALLRERTMEGKETLRQKGAHPGGNHMLPKGIKYRRIRNEDGRVIDRKYVIEPGVRERMRRAYDLLFAGVSYDAAARELGGITEQGLRRTLANPIWYGVRAYVECAQGEEYMPTPRKPLKPGKKLKKRRRRIAREPLLVPIQLHDALTLEPVEPVLTKAEWDRAQEAILRRAVTHKKVCKHADRFLARNVLRCACGKRFYFRKETKHGRQYDVYYCSSCYRKLSRGVLGKPCGLTRSIQRERLDRTLETLLTQKLLDSKFLNRLFKDLRTRKPEVDKRAAEREAILRELRADRDTLIDMAMRRKITQEDFTKRLEPLDRQINSLESQTAVAAPCSTSKELLRKIAHAFAAFAFLRFAERQALLERAVKEVVVSGKAIISVTLRGGFLAAANSPQPC